MIDRIRSATLFALYQTTIAIGILLWPLAYALDRVGLKLPIHRVVKGLGEAVESTGPNGTH